MARSVDEMFDVSYGQERIWSVWRACLAKIDGAEGVWTNPHLITESELI